jgi:SNF2 family DNA or RNA helicase
VQYVRSDADFLTRLHWSVLVVDEAHRLKNADSVVYSAFADLYTVDYKYAARHLPERACVCHLYVRLLLTGTPCQNDIVELWSLLHFLVIYHRERLWS